MTSRYVLVVDDHSDGREILSEYLRFRSIAVRAAPDGEAALQIAFAEPPSVVLMDLSMPGVDGWSATRKLKADTRTKDAIVVAVTAHAFPADRTRAFEHGVDAFVPKPYNIVRLVDAACPVEPQAACFAAGRFGELAGDFGPPVGVFRAHAAG